MIISVYLQVFFNSGLTNNKDDFELCLRAENVELPKSGYFGVSAATGGLAGNFNGHNLSHFTGRSGVYKEKLDSVLALSVLHSSYEHLQEL